jgi:hypothetical protein
MSYFDNRQLKKEIIALDESLVSLSRKIEIERDAKVKAEISARKLVADLEKVKSELDAAKRKILKLKETVREQTGADLLVNALRELGVIPKSKESPDGFIEQDRLLNQLNQQRGNAMQSGFPQSLGSAALGAWR